MGKTSIGSILGGAFGQLKRHPLPVALWCALYVLAMIGTLIAMRPFLAMQSRMTADAAPEALATEMAGVMGWFFLVQIGLMFLMLVLFTASLRAALRPEEPGFGYLRLGLDEFHCFILGVIAVAVFLALYIGAIIVVGIVIASSFAIGGVAAGIAIGAIGALAVIGFMIWIQVRLALAFPLSIMERRLVIAEGWRLSRGHFWTLFGAFLVIAVIMIAVTGVIAVATMGPYFAALSTLDPEKMNAASEAQLAGQLALTPLSLIGFALNGLAGGIWIALAGGGLATAARDLAPRDAGLADTFA